MLAGVFVTGVGYFSYAGLLARYPTTAPIIGFVLVILGLAGSAMAIYWLLKRPVGLVIDHEGILPTRRPSDRVRWSDLKGAHLAEVRSGVVYGPFGTFPQKDQVVALELVDPQGFYKRRNANKRRWLGYDTGARPDYFPISYAHLDTHASRLLYLVTEGIARRGRLAPDARPQTIYPLVFF